MADNTLRYTYRREAPRKCSATPSSPDGWRERLLVGGRARLQVMAERAIARGKLGRGPTPTCCSTSCMDPPTTG